MTTDRPTPGDDTSPATGDPLDELLRQAEWPQATPLQLARLEQQWDRVRPRQRSRWAMRVTAFAAALLMGFVCWQAVPRQADDLAIDELAINEVQPQNPPSLPQSVPPSLETRHVAEVQSERAGQSRPATALEIALSRTAIIQAEHERERLASDPVEQWVAMILRDHRLAIAEFNEPDDVRQQLWCRLLSELPRSQGQRRLALAQLLTMLDLPDTTPALLTLWSDPFTRGVVGPQLVERADVQTLMEMSRAPVTFDEQVRFLSQIAERPDMEAQRLLLLAAMDSRYRQAAMFVTRETHLPPADMLFEALANERTDVRFAAALLLGEIDDPLITERLIEIARQHPRQSDPWVALLRKRDAASRALIAEVRSDPQMYATLLDAELARQFSHTSVQLGAAL